MLKNVSQVAILLVRMSLNVKTFSRFKMSVITFISHLSGLQQIMTTAKCNFETAYSYFM